MKEALFLAMEAHRAGKLGQAERLYKGVLKRDPACFDALLWLGRIAAQRDDHEGALRFAKKALLAQPRSADAHADCGAALFELKRFEEALSSYDAALALAPEDARIHGNRGAALVALRRAEDALESCDRALALRPDYAPALYNRGNALSELRRPAEALASYDRALTIRPDHPEGLYNRGNVLVTLRRFEEARASFDRALALRPAFLEALYNRASALVELQRMAEAVQDYRRVLELAPNYEFTLSNLLFTQLRAGDWTRYAEMRQALGKAVAAGRPAVEPFTVLVTSRSAAEQRRCAASYAKSRYPAQTPLWQGERYRHDRIKLAYVSADFHEHATAYLMAELFETHDRARFETFGISLGAVTKGAMRERLVAAFEHFLDVRSERDEAAAAALRALEIDVLVDLKGYTREGRPGIFAHRPAPVQASYLGYPGTLGAEHIDYIIADRFVIPDDDLPHYAEKVAFLPHYYPVTNAARYFATRTPSRSDVGLPQAGLVLCCFNNSYKITPEMFDVWMRLLRKLDGAVLWLLEDNAASANNLRREAERRGVDARRLVFAPRCPLGDHLARQSLADLFVDTLPYNAHTTAVDALWAGVPVVTCLGTTFVGRVAASLLDAAGLPQLVTHSLDAYETLIATLAGNPADRAALKERLATNRATHPLFDPNRFRRLMEDAFTEMLRRQQCGEQARSFPVPASA